MSRRTSFFALTGDPEVEGGGGVERIEIPIFQRDYAQGRDNERVRQIRSDFLDVLHSALVDEHATVGLDFVYGGVEDGTLRPLDGQQRLTTLFLLHWYLAARSGHLAEDHGWKRFSYATRQSAWMFCQSLVKASPPDGMTIPSDWIENEPWYLFLWRHDPTIQSMLVMIDAIHERFAAVDASAAWARLTDVEDPAIWFLLLPLEDLGSAADANGAMDAEALYIKMNSRGKPLTEFENFKAQFERTIQGTSLAGQVAEKVDTSWSDLLWDLRGDDDLVDDEFLRYMEFVTEVCEWREGWDDGAGRRTGRRADRVFGAANPRREEHLQFLVSAFDVWIGQDLNDTFGNWFTTGGTDGGERIRLFFRGDSSREETPDLFEACCRAYGETHGRTRLFSLGQGLMLYAVLIHLIEGTSDFSRRARVLRNLVEASTDELRLDRMPKILDDVHNVIREGDVGAVGTLNQAQVEDEKLKARFLVDHPELERALFALEDHELLRGSLMAFELDAAKFETRAMTFERLWAEPEQWTGLLGALLAVGEYQRRRTNSRQHLFGTDSKRHDSAWRELLTGAGRERLAQTRQVLGEFLDLIAPSADLGETTAALTKDYLERCEVLGEFDWRYYMVKYPSMRGEGSSTYYAEAVDQDQPAALGYSLCMLRAGGRALNGNYRDPYLLAIWRELGETSDVEDKWFTGHESQPRRLPLTRSGAAIRCVPRGFELSPPPSGADTAAFASVCADVGARPDHVVEIPQIEIDGRRIDVADRIQLGADLVRKLLAAGL